MTMGTKPQIRTNKAFLKFLRKVKTNANEA